MMVIVQDMADFSPGHPRPFGSGSGLFVPAAVAAAAEASTGVDTPDVGLKPYPS